MTNKKLDEKVVDSIQHDLTGYDFDDYPISIYMDLERKEKSYLRDLSVPEVMRLGAVVCQALTELANSDDRVVKRYPEMMPFLEIYGKLSDKLYPDATNHKDSTSEVK